MNPRRKDLSLFLASLAISLAWYAYHSRDFVVMLDRLLHGAGVAYAAVIGWRWWRRRKGIHVESRPPVTRGRWAPLHSWAWWNTVIFFGLVLIASTIATVRYQFSQTQFFSLIGLNVGSFILISLGAWSLSRQRPYLLFHLPLAFGSLLLAYEIRIASTQPPLNQSVVLSPVMGLPFVCYNGGNGRLLNDHYGLPQRRYLTVFVPGEDTFRPPGASDLARRDATAFGTPALSPVQGTVISVVSHLPDLDPGESDPSHPAGNHMCIQFGPARFLYLANLRQHSVLPAVGDEVEVGQAVARLGKNGAFSESALVVIVVTDPNIILPDTQSLPFYFSGMARDDATGPADPMFPLRNQILRPYITPLAPFWIPPTN